MVLTWVSYSPDYVENTQWLAWLGQLPSGSLDAAALIQVIKKISLIVKHHTGTGAVRDKNK